MRNFLLSFLSILALKANKALGAEGGMPQLNSEFWIAQIIWLIFIFCVLYVIVWKVFLPKITNSIENRRSQIVNDLNEAENFKKNAEKKLFEYKKIIENSKNNAKKIIFENRKKVESDIENKKKEFGYEIEKEILNAEKKIKEFKKTSIKNINKIAIETSAEIIRQVINTEINKSSVTAIVEDLSKKKIEKFL